MKQPFFDIYLEFASRETVEQKMSDIPWRVENDEISIVGSWDCDPNPCVIKLLIKEFSLKKIRALAEKLQALRVTYRFIELYPNAPDLNALRARFFML